MRTQKHKQRTVPRNILLVTGIKDWYYEPNKTKTMRIKNFIKTKYGHRTRNIKNPSIIHDTVLKILTQATSATKMHPSFGEREMSKVSGISGMGLGKSNGTQQAIAQGKVLRQVTEVQAYEPEKRLDSESRYKRWAVYHNEGWPRFLDKIYHDGPPPESLIKNEWGDGEFKIIPLDESEEPIKGKDIIYRIGQKRGATTMQPPVPPQSNDLTNLIMAKNVLSQEDRSRVEDERRRAREEEEKREEARTARTLEIEKLKIEQEKLRIEAEARKEEAELKRREDDRKAKEEYERRREEREDKERKDKIDLERDRLRIEEEYRKKKEESEERERKDRIAREEEFKRARLEREEEDRRDKKRREEDRIEREEKEAKERREREEREERERKRAREEREEKEERERRKDREERERIRVEREERETKEARDREERDRKERAERDEREERRIAADEKARRDRFDQLKWGVGLLSPVVSEIGGIFKKKITDQDEYRPQQPDPSSAILPVLDYMRERDEERDRRSYSQSNNDYEEREPDESESGVSDAMRFMRMGMDIASDKDDGVLAAIKQYAPMVMKWMSENRTPKRNQQVDQHLPPPQLPQYMRQQEQQRSYHEQERETEAPRPPQIARFSVGEDDEKKTETKTNANEVDPEFLAEVAIKKIMTDPSTLKRTILDDPEIAKTVKSLIENEGFELIGELDKSASRISDVDSAIEEALRS